MARAILPSIAAAAIMSPALAERRGPVKAILKHCGPPQTVRESRFNAVPFHAIRSRWRSTSPGGPGFQLELGSTKPISAKSTSVAWREPSIVVFQRARPTSKAETLEAILAQSLPIA